MHLFISFLILTYQTTLALVYNDICTKTCDLPGLICENNRCRCDPKSRRFWTGARCAPCPNDWAMTDIECIALYETRMTWAVAKATCENVQADLISFRHRTIIPLIYNITSKSQLSTVSDLRVWTSAFAVDLTGAGLYKWLDKTQKPFTNASDWWCKPIRHASGYLYEYSEPTRSVYNGVMEACAAYWRGTTSTQIVCLDDQLCTKQFPFICEKSESTAQQYTGPAPIASNFLQTTNGTGNSIKNTSIAIGNSGKNTSNNTPKSEKKSNRMLIIIIVVIVVLVLLALICGLVFFLIYRRPVETEQNIINPKKSIQSHRKTIESDLVLSESIASEHIDVQEQENKRVGYSKQQFDELD